MRLRPTRASVLVAVLAASLFVASRTAGSGWLTVMVAVLVALLAWSAADSWLAVRRADVEAVGPTDAVVGTRFELSVSARSPRSGVTVAIHPLVAEPFGVDGSMSGAVVVVARRRGVVSEVHATITGAGSLGLVAATRRLVVTLPRAIDVAPVPTPVSLAEAATLAGQGETAVGGRHSDGETVRSVREYQSGDPMRLINWAVTARRDQLTVKELEAPEAPTLVVAVDLGGPDELAERHASLAAGFVQVGLCAGLPVLLLTHDPTGPHGGGVGSMLEAGRRLARATPGPLPPIEVSGRATVIHLGPRG